MLVARFGAPRLRITWMWIGWAASAAAMWCLALAPNAGSPLRSMFFVIGGLMFGNVLWSPMMQELVPPELLGRASSVDWLMSLSLSPLGVSSAAPPQASSARARRC